jgi:Flp pilus assembly protein TadB
VTNPRGWEFGFHTVDPGYQSLMPESWVRRTQWGQRHPVAVRVLSGTMFAVIFFLLSLIYSSPGRAAATAIIAAPIFTALMWMMVDRRRSHGVD